METLRITLFTDVRTSFHLEHKYFSWLPIKFGMQMVRLEYKIKPSPPKPLLETHQDSLPGFYIQMPNPEINGIRFATPAYSGPVQRVSVGVLWPVASGNDALSPGILKENRVHMAEQKPRLVRQVL